jgi:AraC-like DNA-binding protein
METRSVEVRDELPDATSGGGEHLVGARDDAGSPVSDTAATAPAAAVGASTEAYDIDGLVVSRVRFDASYFERAPSKLRDDDANCIAIEHYLSGSIRGRVGDHELHMAADRICFQDLAVPYVGRAEASEVLGVAIPRHRITSAERIRTQRPTFSLPLDTARGSLLAKAVRGLWDELRAGRVFEPATVADAFLGLVNGLVDHSLETAPEGDALRAMEQYLRKHLNDVTIGVKALEHVFHYSRSTIYRLFEPHGGVVAFIRSERLQRCHAALIRPSTRPLLVSAVASRFGFHDPSQFSRTFRRHYGIAPSELAAWAATQARTRAVDRRGPTAKAGTIESWLAPL